MLCQHLEKLRQCPSRNAMESAGNQALGTISCLNFIISDNTIPLQDTPLSCIPLATDFTGTLNVLAAHQVGANRRYTRRHVSNQVQFLPKDNFQPLAWLTNRHAT